MVPVVVENIQPSSIQKVVNAQTFWIILNLWIICPLSVCALSFTSQPRRLPARINLHSCYFSVGAFCVVISINPPSECFLLVICLCSNKPDFFNSQLWSTFGSSETFRKRTNQMDLTDAQQALTNQGTLLGQHEQVIQMVLHNVATISQSMYELTQNMACFNSLHSPSGAAAPPGDWYACNSEPFDGNLGQCRGFLLQCRVVFSQRLHLFASDEAKINYIIGLL